LCVITLCCAAIQGLNLPSFFASSLSFPCNIHTDHQLCLLPVILCVAAAIKGLNLPNPPPGTVWPYAAPPQNQEAELRRTMQQQGIL
jgi:hypothetical protein